MSFDGDDDLRGDVFVRLEDEQHKELGKLKISGTNVATFPRPETEGVYFVIAEDDGFGHRVQKQVYIKNQQNLDVPEKATSPTMNTFIGLISVLVFFTLLYIVRGRLLRKKHGP